MNKFKQRFSNKKRLFENFEKVNKVKINESVSTLSDNDFNNFVDYGLNNVKEISTETDLGDGDVLILGNINDIEELSSGKQFIHFDSATISMNDGTEYQLNNQQLDILCKFMAENFEYSASIEEFADKFTSNQKYDIEESESSENDGVDNSEIESYFGEKDKKGDIIDGGLGKDKKISDFSKEQLLKGVKVEMEHTPDILIALDIVFDHLTEDPDYYGDGSENPDKLAMINSRKDIK